MRQKSIDCRHNNASRDGGKVALSSDARIFMSRIRTGQLNGRKIVRLLATKDSRGERETQEGVVMRAEEKEEDIVEVVHSLEGSSPLEFKLSETRVDMAPDGLTFQVTIGQSNEE